MLELEPYNLTAAQKPIIVQTHLHLTLSLPPHPTVSIISMGFTIPTLPPTCQVTLNVTKPRLFLHLAVNLYGSSSTTI